MPSPGRRYLEAKWRDSVARQRHRSGELGLQERVASHGVEIDNLARGQSALERRMDTLDASIKDNTDQNRKHYDDLSKQLAQRAMTNWPLIWAALGVCLAGIVFVGGAMYVPVGIHQFYIARDIDDLRSERAKLEDSVTELRGVNYENRTDLHIIWNKIFPESARETRR